MNKIKHWVKADEVTEQGLYLLKRGDVLTSKASLEFFTKLKNGELIDEWGASVKEYHSSFKFARIEDA